MMIDKIRQRLSDALHPLELDVIDESHFHAGHAGARDGGESHFRVRCTSAVFDGKTRVERHRIVNAALAEELQGSIHALALELKGVS